MTAVEPVHTERLLTLPSLGLGQAAEEVVKAGEAHGYTVAATGPGTFRLVRNRRPKWASITAVVLMPFLGLGLLFLLVKQEQSGVITIFEERDGTKARLVGAIDHQIAEHLSRMPKVGSRVPVSSTRESTDFDATSNAAVTDVLGSSSIDDLNQTVVRSPRVEVAHKYVLVLPDGRRLDVAAGLVIGRDPAASGEWANCLPISIDDPSLSKTHLVVVPSPSGLDVIDLHSTNGTRISSSNRDWDCESGIRTNTGSGSQIHAGSTVITVDDTP